MAAKKELGMRRAIERIYSWCLNTHGSPIKPAIEKAYRAGRRSVQSRPIKRRKAKP